MPSEQKAPDIHVCIVGAGFAGLRAAKHFETLGIKYTVFEGSGRVGGRVYPFPYKNGFLQYGAEYVNGFKNEIFEIVQAYNLSIGRTDDLFIINEKTVTVVDGKKLNQDAAKVWNKFVESAEAILNDGPSSEYKSVEEVIDEHLESFSNEVCAENFDFKLLKTLSKLYKNYFQVEWSSPVDKLSMANLEKWDDETGRDDSEVLDKFGFHTILEIMQSHIPKEKIKLNSEVVNINYGGQKVRLRLKNGLDYYFDHIITTSSLGFLKKHKKMMFSPCLPTKKEDAIDQMGFGSNMKIFLEYEKAWWPEDVDGILVANSGSSLKMEEHSKLTENLMVFQASPWEKNVLVAWIAGNGPFEVATMHDDELIYVINNYLINNLKECFNVTRASKLYRHDWVKDEFALGSYSFLTAESEKETIEILAEPIIKQDKPVLCFAGEHTDSAMYQTTVGAARSGLREAMRIAKYYDMSC